MVLFLILRIRYSTPCLFSRYEADHMRNLILEKKTESDLMPHETSRRILKMLKEARDQLDSTAL